MNKVRNYITLGSIDVDNAGLRSNIVDYKNVKLLKKFISETGKVNPRRIAGLSGVQQRQLCIAIKRARQMGLLPYISY